jgi:PAS domain S-box-containing protein
VSLPLPGSPRLRTRLALVALLAVLPALAYIVYGQMVGRIQARDQVVARHQQIAAAAASHHAALFRGVRRSLVTLSNVPTLRAGAAEECHAVLRPVRRDHPEYASLFVVDPAGAVVCSSPGNLARVPDNVSTERWFTRVLETRATALGEYQAGRGRATVIIAHPIMDDARQLARILAADVRLSQLSSIVPPTNTPDARFTLFTRDGTVLATAPQADGLIGTRMADEVLAAVRDQWPAAGAIHLTGSDGRAKLYATAAVESDMDTGLFVSLGLDQDAAMASVDRLLSAQAAWLLFIVVLVGGGALVGSELFVLKPVRALQAVASRIASGDLTARAELSRALPGLREVGGAFDSMATALDARERARDHAEHQLRASEDQYRLLFSDNPQVMWIHDAETLRFLAVNRVACERYGYTVDEFLRLSLKDLHPGEEHAAVDASVTSDRGYQGDWHHRTRDGRTLSVEVRSQRIHWWGTVARLTIADDTSERRDLEEQLRHSQKMDAIGQLAGGVAHDFNNLLTAIQGYADLLADKIAGEDDKQSDLNEIRLAARRAATLTRQLLAFSRKQHLNPKTLRVADVVAGIVPMLTRLVGETIDLKTTASGRGVVVADEGQLEQILVNVIVNARDAMPAGGTIAIETSDAVLDAEHAAHHPDMAAGRYVLLSVSDTGCGMDSKTRERIFEPFFSTKPKDQGTGLGLATVYGIVKQTGGHIRVYSDVGRGTTLKIYLPLSGELVESNSAAPRIVPAGGTERILLVEDEEMVREYVHRMLKRKGYTVLVASTPIEALAIAGREPKPIDLLVTDVVLPEMNGPALASELRRCQPDCRVLYMSGYTANAVLRHGWDDDEVDFLQKPFTQDALGAKVREILDRAPAVA